MSGVLILCGCQANGGGVLASTAACQRPTTFGFIFTLPNFGADGTFAGSFNDPCAGVSFKGTGRLSPSPAPAQGPVALGGCLAGSPTYESTDPGRPGSGTVNLFVCDSANSFGTAAAEAPGNAQAGDGDFVMIDVTSGPLAPYTYAGVVTHGNIVVRP